MFNQRGVTSGNQCDRKSPFLGLRGSRGKSDALSPLEADDIVAAQVYFEHVLSKCKATSCRVVSLETVAVSGGLALECAKVALVPKKSSGAEVVATLLGFECGKTAVWSVTAAAPTLDYWCRSLESLEDHLLDLELHVVSESARRTALTPGQ